MNSWRRTTLGDVIELQRGYDLPERVRKSGTVSVIGSAGLTGWHNEARVCGPGVVVGRAGASAGAVTFVPNDFWPHNATLYVKNFKGNNPKFISYLLRTLPFDDINSGSAQQMLNRNYAYLLPISIPTLTIQRRISGILTAYDDLIEVNRRRIAVLEDMARRLFDEWFVHFRFPGHEGHKMVETEHGMLPEGWTVRVVEELVKRIPVGRKYDQKTVSALGAVPVFDQGKTGIIGYHNDAPGVSASEHDPVVVFANHTCYQRLVHFPFSAIQNVLPFVPNPAAARNIYWLHWATNGLVSLNDYKGHWPEFAAKKVVVPIAELCKRFGDFVAPLSLSILRLGQSDENLAKARELLLPRLISGELPVAAAEDALEEAA